MESSLSPREIQTRIRAGASVTEVAQEAGAPEARIQVFADPVLAEREHIARTALGATIRRKGDGSAHRRLGSILSDRLRARGLDSDDVVWDAWREPDMRWRVVGKLADDAAGREAEFLFDPRARFSVADNGDARWMIGEELPGSGPDDENTVDFDDELALVRATQSPDELMPDEAPGDAIPHPYDPYADVPHTSELDELYDMLSGVSEDSVRIYVGLDDDDTEDMAPTDDEAGDEPLPSDDVAEAGSREQDAAAEEAPETDEEQASGPADAHDSDEPQDEESIILEPRQDSLIENVPGEEPAPVKKRRRRRAHVPSWDEIMFGGPKPGS